MRNAFISVHGYEAALHIHHMYLLSLCMGVCGKPLSLTPPLRPIESRLVRPWEGGRRAPDQEGTENTCATRTWMYACESQESKRLLTCVLLMSDKHRDAALATAADEKAQAGQLVSPRAQVPLPPATGDVNDSRIKKKSLR